jgi:hypothetical protein
MGGRRDKKLPNGSETDENRSSRSRTDTRLALTSVL